MVKFYSCGNYSSDNYGVNSLCFEEDNGDKYYFSYKTLVAFKINGEFHIIKNYWGNTTGKHLNLINADKSIREDERVFMENYYKLTLKRIEEVL